MEQSHGPRRANEAKPKKKKTPVASKQEGSYVASRTSVEVDKKEGKVKPTQQIHVVIYNQLEDKYAPNIQHGPCSHYTSVFIERISATVASNDQQQMNERVSGCRQ